ncbi:MAG: DMT family transporter [Gammaproteobacteria bacterium]
MDATRAMIGDPTRQHFVRAAPAVFVLIWSTGYVGARFGLPYAEPLTFVSLRLGIVVILLLALLRLRGSRLPRSPHTLAHLAVSGMLIHAAFQAGVYLAIARGVDISIAALVAGAQPLLAAVLIGPLLGERLARRQWAGFILGFVGLAMVVVRGFDLGTLDLAGFAACLLALAGITFGTLYQKRFVAGADLIGGSTVQFAAAFLPCAAGALVFETRVIAWNPTFVLALAWLCVALSLGAVTILLFLVREGAASRVSSLFYLVPPVTALQGYAFFGERLTPAQWGGIAVVALGVALINLAPRARPR